MSVPRMTWKGLEAELKRENLTVEGAMSLIHLIPKIDPPDSRGHYDYRVGPFRKRAGLLLALLRSPSKYGAVYAVDEVRSLLNTLLARQMIYWHDRCTDLPRAKSLPPDLVRRLVCHYGADVDVKRLDSFKESGKLMEALSALWYISHYSRYERVTQAERDRMLLSRTHPDVCISRHLVRLVPQLYALLQEHTKDVIPPVMLAWPHWDLMPAMEGMIPYLTKDQAVHLQRMLLSEDDPRQQGVFEADCLKITEVAGRMLQAGPTMYLSQALLGLMSQAVVFMGAVQRREWRPEPNFYRRLPMQRR